LAMFREMKNGTDLGRKHCIRARIAFDSSNGSMRDPVIYRFPNWKGAEPAGTGTSTLPTISPAPSSIVSRVSPTRSERPSMPTVTSNTTGSSTTSSSARSTSGSLPVSTLSEHSFPSESLPRLSTPVVSAAGTILACLPSAVSSVVV
jgi:hypothetical protein